MKQMVATAAAFKYQKFHNYEEALQWMNLQTSIYKEVDSFIHFSKAASEPFQFMAKVLGLRSIDLPSQSIFDLSSWSVGSDCKDVELSQLPISQDASASAYQIMSYLLLNEEMAIRTNLIAHPSGQIQDVYTAILQDLQEYLHERIHHPEKWEIIASGQIGRASCRERVYVLV